MVSKIEKLQARLTKLDAAEKKLKRQTQLVTFQLGKQERRADTRRKILIGSWAVDKADRVPEFYAEMHRELNRVWLVRDDDRTLFGLEPLSEIEKAARGIVNGKFSAVASAAPSDNSADATATQHKRQRETEDA